MKKTNQTSLSGIVEPLLAWYGHSARVLPWRENTDPYRVWVSEIMLQQTRVEAVKPYFERFLERLPTLESLAEAPEEELLKLWEGLGYYARARNLQKTARILCRDWDGRFPHSPEALRGLPGIGAYTAGAIASISFGLPTPAVDGNVLRVISRLTASPADIADPAVKAGVADALAAVYPPGRAGDFTQSLMELGALLCTPGGAPRCGDCPLAGLCGANRDGTQSRFPVKAKKPPRRQEQKTVLLLWNGERTAVRKREEGGLLGGLWEFPNLPGPLTDREVRDWLERQGITVRSVARGRAAKHVFTHVEWRLESWRVDCDGQGGDLLWVAPETLDREIALPTAFRRFRDEL